MLKRLMKPMKRTVAMLLCAMLFLGALPVDILPHAEAAEWYDSYMSQQKRNGVMDGTRPNDPITRAEMCAVLNRTFGFSRTGSIPFTDVPRNAWYYNDIATTYNEGIFTGTSPTKASPSASVTREQFLTLLGRCLRYETKSGQVTAFKDGNTFGNWSAIYVNAALKDGIVGGYNDGTFRPKKAVTRAEVSKMLSIGTGELIKNPGTKELGSVFTDVTVSSPNVTLRNTTIAGDLYLTGGVGLGNVVLENVNVLGRIIVAGGGVSESGQPSILLNTVKAKQLVVDPATGQQVSLRAIGNTDIPETLVKSNAYIQDDVRNPEMGLEKVIFTGPKGGQFTIAGNMKDVVLKAPNSQLIVGDTGTGSVSKITVDEHATGSRLNLEVNAAVDDIKLDTATTITGTGDIGHLDVVTNGSSSTILPDSVTVWPGVITDIAGIKNIDSEKAKELSEDPQILEGYPQVRNLAPQTAEVYFSTNKAGTIYWALTNAAKGPLTDSDVENIISPPAYGAGFQQSGSLKITASKDEFKIKLSKLAKGGTYYISAVLVDEHDRRSQVKAQQFVTPDNTKPAMNKGYPYVDDRTPTRNEENVDLDFSQIAHIEATVMANKNCDLYYVLLASGSGTPSDEDFLTNTFSDPYGYGRIHMIKNTMDTFDVTEIDADLDGNVESRGEVQESTKYDLYLWLYDGEQGSKVSKLSITTKDVTPPEFTMGEMVQTNAKATSITFSNALNEAGTVYWVAVKSGDPYPRPSNGTVYPDTPAWREFLSTLEAKQQVARRLYGVKSGSTKAKADTQFNITVNGLAKESAYDIYYLAEDNAKNYSVSVGKFTAYTLDQSAPTATQVFEDYPEESPSTPYAYSTIDVVFSESIRYNQPSSDSSRYDEVRLLELYNAYRDAKSDPSTSPDAQDTLEKAEKQYVSALRNMIILYDVSTGRPAIERTGSSNANSRWQVDYRNVQVRQDGAKMVVSFINNTAADETSSLNLESGSRYFFRLQNIADNSQAHNAMAIQNLDVFTTVSAQVMIGTLGDLKLNAYELDENGEIDQSKPILAYNDYKNKENEEGSVDIPIDISFTAEPRSTSTASASVDWDMLFWFDTSVKFELFTRVHGTTDWVKVGGPDAEPLSILVPAGAQGYRGVSLTKSYSGSPANFRPINEAYQAGLLGGGLNDENHIIYDFALHFVDVDDNSDRLSFNQEIKGQVTFVTGTAGDLNNIFPSDEGEYNRVINNENQVTDITVPNNPGALDTVPRLLRKQFEDGRAPQINMGYPRFKPTPGGVETSFLADRPGTLYYIIAPRTSETTYALEPSITGSNGTNTTVGIEKIEQYVSKNGGSYPTMTTDIDSMKKRFPDNPDINENYRFSFPSQQSVVQPKGSFPNIDEGKLITNHIEVSQSEITTTIAGLTPDTDYLIYMVTKGKSDVLSPVTVYQFHTDPLAKPILWTQANNTQATINSDLDATVSYKLLQYDSSNLPYILNRPFKDSGVTSEFNAYRSRRSTWKTGSSGFMSFNDNGFTVLDAMIETIESGGRRQGSLFDLCADEDLKQSVRQYIESSGGDSLAIGSNRNQKVSSSSPLSVNCERWGSLLNVNYCLVVCGYSGTAQNQSGYAFSAAYPIAKRKEQIKASLVSGITYNRPDPNNPYDTGTLSGTLTLNFTDNLCIYNDDRTPPERIVLYANNRGGAVTGGYSQDVGNYLSTTASYEVTPRLSTGSRNKVRSIIFDIQDAPTSFSITLSGARFSGETSEPQDYPLQINVVTNKTSGAVTVSIAKTNDPLSEWQK